MKLRRLLQAGLVTATTDFIFSSVLVKFFYHSSVTRLWQGVASVPLGPSALQGGSRTVLIGLALHLTVALTWSIVFLTLYSAISRLRSISSTVGGALVVACVYGPLIWMTMSFIVIQHFTNRPPTINVRWWVQFFGHIPFVALPIVALLARR